MIIKNIDIANLKEQLRINKYCIEKYGCSFSDLSDLERKKVVNEIKNTSRLDNKVENGLEQPGRTCDDCRWKVERHECPWNYNYDKYHPWAEDCNDFRNVRSIESAFDG